VVGARPALEWKNTDRSLLDLDMAVLSQCVLSLHYFQMGESRV
jgi:hypothetical protein